MEVWNRQVSEAAHQAALRMPIELARVAPFTLAGLEIDPPRKSIRAVGGQEEILEPRVMQVLCALVRAEGAILTRDDLTASCWAGTHVGEDALQRVIARLRKLANGIGKERIEIETLPRIGYRLVSAEIPAAASEERTEGARAPAPRKRHLVSFAIGLALVLLAAGAYIWWPHPHAQRSFALRIDPLVQTKDVAAGTADQFNAQLRASLANAEPITLRPDRPDYRLTATVAQDAPDALRYTVALQAADGTIPWSDSFPSATAADAQRRLALGVGRVVRCGLGGLSIYPHTLPPAAAAFFFDLCKGGAYRRQIDIGQRLTAMAPDFAPGWSRLASAYEAATFMSSPGEAAGFRTQALDATRRAIALDPNIGTPWQIQAYLLPPDAPLIEREKLLQKAVSGYSDCGCEHRFYQYFLTAVGRIDAAIGEAQRAADTTPDINAGSMARVVYFSGQPAQAAAMLAPMASEQGRIADWARLDHAIYVRDWAGAAAVEKGQVGDQTRQPLAEAYAALASGDQARIARAADAVERIARAQADGHYQQHQSGISDQPGLLLAAMGRPDGAFDAIAAMIRTNGPEGLEMLFDPIMAPYRDTPRYVAMLKASGLIAYWRTTHTQPDLCTARGAPGWCQGLLGH